MSVPTINPNQLAKRIQEGGNLDLIDVRTPAEFREMHLAIARNVPLDRLDPEAIRKDRNGSGDSLFVICRSGSRGKQACEKLIAAGLQNVVNVDGGTLACEAEGLPLVRGQATMSLERQVRIAAGSLVLIGAALGAFVHPAWIGLSAFVGAGLVFAGVTDTCGMAMLLAKMPWNQAGATCCNAKTGCGVAEAGTKVSR